MALVSVVISQVISQVISLVISLVVNADGLTGLAYTWLTLCRLRNRQRGEKGTALAHHVA
jgi:hypothetical protein